MTAQTIIRKKSKAKFYRETLNETVTLEMVYIPGGEFRMGATDEDTEEYIKAAVASGSKEEEARSWSKDEKPRHPVTVPTFFMGRYPITQAQYMAIMGENPSEFKGKPDSDRHPVENVTWENANEFCERLSEKTEREYRLPSEAQWEYACRAGTTTPFHFGETISTEVANYDGNYTYGKGEKGEYREETTPVDFFGVANEYGLSDMHGNVWEWCLDAWHDNYKGAPSDGSPWIGSKSDRHILRGGSWIFNPRYCRSAYRGIDDIVNFNIGFRVISVAPGLS